MVHVDEVALPEPPHQDLLQVLYEDLSVVVCSA